MKSIVMRAEKNDEYQQKQAEIGHELGESGGEPLLTYPLLTHQQSQLMLMWRRQEKTRQYMTSKIERIKFVDKTIQDIENGQDNTRHDIPHKSDLYPVSVDMHTARSHT